MNFKSALSLVCLLFLFSSAYSNIDFLEIGPEQALEKAFNSEKYIFTYFYNKDLPVCMLMEEKTFQDINLKNAIDSNFIPIRIEVESELFKQWEELYNIKCVPTCLVINASGKSIEIIEGAYSASGLLNKLKKAIIKDRYAQDFEPVKHLIEPDLDFLIDYNLSSEVKGMSFEDSLITSDENMNNEFYTNFLYQASDETQEDGTTVVHKTIDKKKSRDILKLKGAPLKRSYEIQLGYFKKYQNAIALIESLKTRIDQDILITEELKGNEKNYRVVIGNKLSKKEAVNQMKELSQSGVECFIRLSSKK